MNSIRFRESAQALVVDEIALHPLHPLPIASCHAAGWRSSDVPGTCARPSAYDVFGQGSRCIVTWLDLRPSTASLATRTCPSI